MEESNSNIANFLIFQLHHFERNIFVYCENQVKTEIIFYLWKLLLKKSNLMISKLLLI